MAVGSETAGTMKRRGILAAAGAVVAGIVAKQVAQPVAASITDTNFIANGTVDFGFDASTFGTFRYGVSGQGSVNGVTGTSNSGTGVFGQSSGDSLSKGIYGKHLASGYAVYGEATASLGYGVTGVSTNAFGVLGQSTSGIGVEGQITGGSTANTVGVKGLNQSTGAGGVGVSGTSNIGIGVQGGITGSPANTVAVQGNNTSTGANSHGVVGQSATGYGVLGYSTGGSASLSGISTNVNIPAFAGGNSVAGGLAASFAGTVYVNGMFVVADMTQKHGLLKHPDGSHRLMYTVEAPESWAEDFGSGTLTNGKGEIKLDPDFAALMHTEDYHVFLTEHAHHHLAVTQRGAGGFTVEADMELAQSKGKKASDLAGTFSWRVVAKPKSDKKVERLGKFTVPNVPLPDISKLPKPSERPVTPPMKP